MANKRRRKNTPTVNWFGNNKRQVKSNLIFSFLGNPQVAKPKIQRRIDFLGTNKSRSPVLMPNLLFKKESIKDKKLSKWGDADLDGTPNYFDCDPMRASKDQMSAEELIAETRRIRLMPPEEQQQMIAKITAEEKPRKGIIRKAVEEIKARDREDEIPETASYRKAKEKFKELKARGIEDTETKELEKGIKAYEEKIRKASERAIPMKKALETSELAFRRYLYESKIAKGKVPTQREIKGLVKAEKKAKMLGPEGKLEKIRRVLPAGEVIGALTGAALTKEGTYTKAARAKAQRMRRMVSVGVGAIFGPSLTQTRFDSEPRGRGRPAGPSGEYRIGSRPVYEEEYRQWESKQKALNRMLPSEAQTQTLNPEYIEYMKTQAEAERQKAAEKAVATKEIPAEEMPAEEMPAEEIPAESGYAQRTAPTIQEIRDAQYQAQQQDNILNAPNFSKGELKATGGSLLTPVGPSILEAPQVFRGEMRNTQSKEEMPAVRLSERPQTNPYGDEYLEIEIGSGKPVIRKRIRERWMSGEAL